MDTYCVFREPAINACRRSSKGGLMKPVSHRPNACFSTMWRSLLAQPTSLRIRTCKNSAMQGGAKNRFRRLFTLRQCSHFSIALPMRLEFRRRGFWQEASGAGASIFLSRTTEPLLRRTTYCCFEDSNFCNIVRSRLTVSWQEHVQAKFDIGRACCIDAHKDFSNRWNLHSMGSCE